ncbi:MAG: nucleoside deaminase [Nitrospira sp.]|nr:nucleoside deaminase [Nitrospira sp.]
MALQQARLAPLLGEVPIGAVLVHQNEVIAAAHNYRELSQDPTAHAEMIVIRKAAEQLKTWRLTDTTLYVTLEPCPMCAGAIVQARITRLVFGAWDPKAGACGSILNIPVERRFNHRVQVAGGLFEQESRALLQEFFAPKEVTRRRSSVHQSRSPSITHNRCPTMSTERIEKRGQATFVDDGVADRVVAAWTQAPLTPPSWQSNQPCQMVVDG